MLQKIIKVLIVISMTMILSANAANACEIKLTSLESELVSDSADIAGELADFDEILNFIQPAVRQGEPYDEAKDPAMHKNTPPEEGPQHGYFAVSLLVISIVGVFLYFLKVD